MQSPCSYCKLNQCTSAGMDNNVKFVLFMALLLGEQIDAVLINIRPYRFAILQSHNFYRRLEPASNMRYMSWDYRLERSAARWSESCYFEHQRVGGLGENLSYFTSSGPPVPPRTVTQRSLALWAGEKRIWGFSRSCGRACHYTQMIWATSSRVGCALSYCPVIRVGFGGLQRNAMYLVCRYYPPGNFIGQYPYIPGPRCSRCGYGSFCFQGLCAGGFGPIRRRFFGRRRRSIRESSEDKFLKLVNMENAKTPKGIQK